MRAGVALISSGTGTAAMVDTPVQLTWRDRLPSTAMKIIVGVAGIAMLATVFPPVLDGFRRNLDQRVPRTVYQYTRVITVLAFAIAMWGRGAMIGIRASAPKRSLPTTFPWTVAWLTRAGSHATVPNDRPAMSARRRDTSPRV